MSDQITITRKTRNLKGRIVLAGSKSISNRLLLMRALSGQLPEIHNLSDADDTIRLKKLLEQISVCADSRIPMVVDASDAGTVFRFLTAFLSAKKGCWLVTGTKRMKERPVKDLVDALNQLDAEIHYKGSTGFPPLQILGGQLWGETISVNPSKSSQFVSAIMMIAPLLDNNLVIRLTKKPVSVPYIKMTAALMKRWGISVKMSQKEIVVEASDYKAVDSNVEPDWSSASYWYETAALADSCDLFLPGLSTKSIQGDSRCAEIFEQLGVLTVSSKTGIKLKKNEKTVTEFVYDFSGCPDLVPAVMVSCAAKKIPAIFQGVSHLRYKESNRIKSLTGELAKLGCRFETAANSIRLIPDAGQSASRPIEFNTFSDHRLAMAFAPLVLKTGKIMINDPSVVSKSYPSFWNDLASTELVTIDKNDL